MPPRCPNQLAKDQIRQFQEDGFLAFSDVLEPGELKLAREALTRIARELTESRESVYSAPKRNGANQSGATFKRPGSRSMLQVEPGFDPGGKSPQKIELMVRKFMWFCTEDAVFENMLCPAGRIHGIVECLLGADPILFQEMALVKPPFIGTEKPWHQDNAYFSVEPLDEVIGVWIALDEATPENGCMHVIPGAHAAEGFKHHHGTDCEIDPALLDVSKAVAVPVPAGGAMFFYGMLPHETPPNRSPHRRRALQFHFRGSQTRIVDEETYDRLFVDRSGAPASCRAASRTGF